MTSFSTEKIEEGAISSILPHSREILLCIFVTVIFCARVAKVLIYSSVLFVQCSSFNSGKPSSGLLDLNAPLASYTFSEAPYRAAVLVRRSLYLIISPRCSLWCAACQSAENAFLDRLCDYDLKKRQFILVLSQFACYERCHNSLIVIY